MTEFDFIITKRVYERYPKTEKERTCWQERQRLTKLRQQYKVRLESEAKQKKNTGIVP
jgi:hypothetical protein